MTRYGMAIDTKRCYACNKCSMACKVEHNLPNNVLWSRARTVGGEQFLTPEGEYPHGLSMGFYTLACQHCSEPACVENCPTGASMQREDGIVTVDYEKCIGCGACMTACPYEGVRTLLEAPEYLVDWKVGDISVPDLVENTMSKCTFCVERIDRGENPLCVDICHSYARYFGDLDDPESAVSKVIAGREYDQLLADMGTGPNVYFLK